MDTATDNPSEQDTLQEDKDNELIGVTCTDCEKQFKKASGLKQHKNRWCRAERGSPTENHEGGAT